MTRNATEQHAIQPAWDVVLAGGGLASSLVALFLAARRPGLKVLILERGAALGGNHTWSCHTTDLSPDACAVLEPAVAAAWPRQMVLFPGAERVLEAGYLSLTSQRLAAAVTALPGVTVLPGAEVASLDPGRALLADGRTFAAPCVIDSRGLPADGLPLSLGYQKFVGLEIETEAPHGEACPVIMDATVPQLDGYRFVYTLPFDARRLLVEDTYYADGPALDAAAIRTRAESYAVARGWRIGRLERVEQGVLPVVLAGDIDALWRQGDPGVPRIGLRAALFHPTTGYSLPDAAALAESLVGLPELTSAAVRAHVERRSRRLWQARGFYRVLNRLLFVAAAPAERVRIMARFYRLPDPVIARFYAASLTMADKAQIVAIMAVRPPLPLAKALGAMPAEAGIAFARRTREVR